MVWVMHIWIDVWLARKDPVTVQATAFTDQARRTVATASDSAGRPVAAAWNRLQEKAVNLSMSDVPLKRAGARRDPIKVVHAVRTVDPAAGGFITYVDNLRRGLTGRDVETRTEGVFPSNANWRVMALRRPLRFLPRMKRRLADAHLLHIHGLFGWHALLSARAARAVSRPYVVTVHGHLHPDALRERLIAKRIYLAWRGRAILEGAAAVLVTTSVERALVERYAPRARVRELTPGLPVPAAPASHPSAGGGGSKRPLRVLYLGRLHPHKGLHLLIQAMDEGRADGLDAALTVDGTGLRRYRRSLEALVARSGLADRVRFLGHVDAPRRFELFATTDVLVLPSRSENFGFAPAEAMAAGMPVVITENVGLAELVARRQCGRVVPVGDVDAVRRALLDYADPALRRDHGPRGRAAALETFSIEVMGATMESVYRDVVRAGGR